MHVFTGGKKLLSSFPGVQSRANRSYPETTPKTFPSISVTGTPDKPCSTRKAMAVVTSVSGSNENAGDTIISRAVSVAKSCKCNVANGYIVCYLDLAVHELMARSSRGQYCYANWTLFFSMRVPEACREALYNETKRLKTYAGVFLRMQSVQRAMGSVIHTCGVLEALSSVYAVHTHCATNTCTRSSCVPLMSAWCHLLLCLSLTGALLQPPG